MKSRSPLGRRLRTIPILFAGLILVWGLLPVLVVAAVATDAVRWISGRTPWMAIRLILFLVAYLTAEAIGVTALFLTWIASGFGASERVAFTTAFGIQKAWAGFLFWVVRRIFRLSVDVEGLDAVDPAPFILLARHTSIVDNLLPSHFITRPHNTHIRYVMKDELLLDPALDIAGNRLPNLFVRRGAGEGERESQKVRQLAESTGPQEAILIYPEGTRFSERKRERALKALEKRNPDLHERASEWRSILPPRLGGTLALLEGCAADIVVLSHRGLDGFARIADIWRGAMVGNQIQVRFQRIPRHLIPDSRSGRADWLYDVWDGIDRWVIGAASAPDAST